VLLLLLMPLCKLAGSPPPLLLLLHTIGWNECQSGTTTTVALLFTEC
jgi:hypothetical protein